MPLRIRSSVLALVLFAAALLAPAGLQHHAGAATRRYAPDSVLVAYKPLASHAARLGAAARAGMEPDASVRNPYFARLRMTLRAHASGASVATALAMLRADPAVRVAEPDFYRQAQGSPNDPQFPQQWGLRNTGQTGGTSGADISAVAAWDVTAGSDLVTVAVIDTGVDYNHPDLTDNILRLNGQVVGYDFHNGDADPMDDNNHGTHCAGILGARGGNALGVTGVCQRVKIMPLKFLGGDGTGLDSDAISCIDYARLHGAQILSNSWGGPDYSQLLLEAIQRARDAGILFVAAAGNEGSSNDSEPSYPANFNQDVDNVISVAASTDQDQLAGFSNYGAVSVDLAAPGQSILSTVRASGYQLFSGTSMACPHVAGAAALTLAQDGTLSLPALKSRVLGGVDHPSGLAGKVRLGRLNVASAVTVSGFRISGTVLEAGGGVEGVTVSAGSRAAITGPDGKYTILGLAAGTYTVSPSKSGYTFSPASRSVTLGPDKSDVDFTATATLYAIAGTVRANGAGLGGVTVAMGQAATTTATDGTYSFGSLRAGLYRVAVSKQGYTFSPDSTQVLLGPSQAGVDFAATELALYSISGTIRESGAGLGGVTVSMGGRTATTLPNGSYAFTGLSAGSYTLTPGKSGYLFNPLSKTLSLSSNISGVDFTGGRTNGLTVSGRVTLGAAGLSGVTVGTGTKSAVTNADGTYALTGLNAGAYTFTASKAGYALSPATQSVTLSGDLSNINFAAAPTYTISGYARLGGQALAGVLVSAGSHSAATSGDGSYVLKDLVSGDWLVTASKAGYSFTPASALVAVGPSIADLDFAATSTGFTVQGKVTGDAAVPLAGVTVGAGGVSAITAGDGTYTLTLATAGIYSVRATLAGYTFTPSSSTVTVGPNRTGVNFEAHPVPTAALSAVVVAPTSVKGGKTATGTVKLTLPATQSTQVSLTSSKPGAASLAASVTVSAGTASASFTVRTKKAAKKSTVTVTAAYSGVTRQAVLTIKP